MKINNYYEEGDAVVLLVKVQFIKILSSVSKNAAKKNSENSNWLKL